MSDIVATEPDTATATISVELFSDEHRAWLGAHPMAPTRDDAQPTVVRRRDGAIVTIFPATGTVAALDVVAAELATTWPARHIPNGGVA